MPKLLYLNYNVLEMSIEISNYYFPAPPVTSVAPSVTFPIPREQFTITWDEPLPNINEMIDAYFVNISGPEDLCRNGNTLQRVTERNYTCSIQTTPQEGDIYTITVSAASCGGNLTGPESEPLHLQGTYYRETN